MRKNMSSIVVLLVMTAIFLGAGLACADVLPRNSHNVARYISVVNAQDFPEVALVAYITGPMLQEPEVREILAGEYLSKGYKFNRYRIFCVPRYLYNQHTGFKALKFEDIPEKGVPSSRAVYLLSDSIDPGTRSVPNDNPLVAEHLEYRLLKNQDGTFMLVLAKETREYDHQRYGAPGVPKEGEGQIDGKPVLQDRSKGSADS